MQSILCVILARGGSKGIPRKNIVELRGKPILAYTIEAAQNAKRLDHIVVSTEDDEIEKVAERYNAEVVKRPTEYAKDSSPMELSLRHAVQAMNQQGKKIDIVVSLYACIPVRKEGIIDLTIDKLISSGADSVQTYAPYTTPPQWAYTINDDKVEILDEKYRYAYRRQMLTPAFHPDGAALAIRYQTLMEAPLDSSDPHAFMGNDRRAIIQPPEDTVDVDEPIDLLWADFLLSRKKT